MWKKDQTCKDEKPTVGPFQEMLLVYYLTGPLCNAPNGRTKISDVHTLSGENACDIQVSPVQLNLDGDTAQ
jgi:hypothetical protein